MSAIPNPFLITMIAFLEPYFICAGIDIAATHAEIVETLGSYGTRSRSEILNAAQIIAFGMSTLETLREAKADDMSSSMRVRYRGCANGLNRSGQQNEKNIGIASGLRSADSEGPGKRYLGCDGASGGAAGASEDRQLPQPAVGSRPARNRGACRAGAKGASIRKSRVEDAGRADAGVSVASGKGLARGRSAKQ